jgi:serine protease
MPRSNVTPICEGLLVHAGDPIESHAAALGFAREIVGRNLPGRWNVQPIHRGSRDFVVLRDTKAKRIVLSTAWDYVHRLAADRDVLDAEPLLELPGLEPDPEHFRELLAPDEQPAPKSLIAKAPKPCSADCEWSLKLSRIIDAWAVTLPKHGHGKRFGEGIRVGHPDTGYTPHPEIWEPGPNQRIRADLGFNFVNAKSDPRDPFKHGFNKGHGTATASVIMSGIGPADPSNTKWVTGSAPMSEVVPFRVIETVVVFNFLNVARAIYHAVDAGCHVISMSLGGAISSIALRNAVDHAIDRGVIVLAAAGNFWPYVVYPARLDQVIAVAAVDCAGKPWRFTARGADVDLAAPGESVWVARTPKDNPTAYTVERGTGTSFAVTTTAGACALWLAYHGRDRLIAAYGEANLASVFREVLVTAGVRRPAGWDARNYGAGTLDAERLLKAPLPRSPRAKGLAKRGAARATPLEEILALFPDITPAAMRKALADTFKMTDAKLDAFLEDFGPEIAFHLATDARLRQSVRDRARGKKARGAAVKGTVRWTMASRRLRDHMNR